ncbi:hypothetical protein N7539_006224 [Penicillium diatomitis]|uniref:CBM21 domain-containing protein n=1 Tax=Penicillium diatomitis TaxID=2819901 RepID=A0A9W9X2Q5_9EURO|nr:uncharacterized protein N7539_006224 [Penicillium diatomitis]KAJ5482778.1 hypothetical protein N7539_006224 [Penicillium diatomitis]
MPYTAPAKTLPAAQHIEYTEASSGPRTERSSAARPATHRSQSSRSYSSTSYVRRHRRSPSISKTNNNQSPTETTTHPHLTIDPHASLRQSPPPLNNAMIPPGAVISPPESVANSSDEDSSGSKDEIKLEELEAAVRSIEQRRESSPERGIVEPTEGTGTEAQPSSSQVSTPPQAQPEPKFLRLSKEHRKISHSRSSTESAVDLKREQALTSSPDDSDAEAAPKPPMVRKKSGELVRPALRPATARRRPSSMPGTPNYAKAVHFDSQLEHIRHFLQLDRPLAVSAETSPVDSYDGESEFPFGHDADKSTPSWEWELRLTNFPKDTDASRQATHAVRLDRLCLSFDKKSLIGSVSVANLAFHKHVAARFTFDYWRTVSEVTAVYNNDVRRKHSHDGYDRFTFDIKLDDQANLESKTMFVCIRYNVDGQEHWDNNQNKNYQVDFVKVPKSAPRKAAAPSRPSLPRSRTFTGSTSSSRQQSMPPSFDNFPEVGKSASFGSSFNTKVGPMLSRSATNDIDTIGPPKRREKPHPQAFGNRYDFGASLTAAIQTKPPVDRTTLTARARSSQPTEAPKASAVEKDLDVKPGRISPVRSDVRPGDLKPSSLVSSKPCHESSSYKELVDKYCFYGSPVESSTPEKAPSFSNFTLTLKGNEKSRFLTTAAPSPPLSPRSLPARESTTSELPHSDNHSTSMNSGPGSPRISRSTSPSMNFRYPYHQKTLQNGFMKDPQSSPVIRGGYDVSFLEMPDSLVFPSFANASTHAPYVGVGAH